MLFTEHSVEPCGRSNILAQRLFKTMLRKTKVANSCVHIGKNLVNMHNKNGRSRKISRNASAPKNMTNIHMWISQLVKVENLFLSTAESV